MFEEHVYFHLFSIQVILSGSLTLLSARVLLSKTEFEILF